MGSPVWSGGALQDLRKAGHPRAGRCDDERCCGRGIGLPRPQWGGQDDHDPPLLDLLLPSEGSARVLAGIAV